MIPLFRPVLRGIVRPVVRVILGEGGGGVLPPDILAFILTEDVKLWALFKGGKMPTYTKAQAYGMAMSMEL